MSTIKKVTDGLSLVIKSKNIQKDLDDTAENLTQLVMAGDIKAGLTLLKNISDIGLFVPNLLFWDKMNKFLRGTFRDFEEQVRMSSKFSKDNDKFEEFVFQMIETIDKLDMEVKVDYYSNLTRARLLELINDDLFYKMRQLIMNCTISELKFIDSHKENDYLDYNLMVFSLKMLGLADQVTDNQPNYVFTELAKKFKEIVLNDDNTPKHKTEYSEIPPPNDTIYATDSEVKKMFEIKEVY